MRYSLIQRPCEELSTKLNLRLGDGDLMVRFPCRTVYARHGCPDNVGAVTPPDQLAAAFPQLPAKRLVAQHLNTRFSKRLGRIGQEEVLAMISSDSLRADRGRDYRPRIGK